MARSPWRARRSRLRESGVGAEHRLDRTAAEMTRRCRPRAPGDRRRAPGPRRRRSGRCRRRLGRADDERRPEDATRDQLLQEQGPEGLGAVPVGVERREHEVPGPAEEDDVVLEPAAVAAAREARRPRRSPRSSSRSTIPSSRRSASPPGRRRARASPRRAWSTAGRPGRASWRSPPSSMSSRRPTSAAIANPLPIALPNVERSGRDAVDVLGPAERASGSR